MKSRNLKVVNTLDELGAAVNDGRFNVRGTRRELVVRCSAGIAKAKGISVRAHSRCVF
jgi:hypothetical protein